MYTSYWSCSCVRILFVCVVVARQPCGNNNTSTTSILASGTSTFASTTTTTPQPQPQPQLNSLSSPPQQYNPIYSRRHHHRGRTEYLSYLYCTVMNSGTTTTITTQQPHRNRNQSRGTINPLSSPPQQYNQIRSKPYQTKPIQYGTRGSCCFNAWSLRQQYNTIQSNTIQSNSINLYRKRYTETVHGNGTRKRYTETVHDTRYTIHGTWHT